MIVPCRYGAFQYLCPEDLISKSLQEYGEWAQQEIEGLAVFIRMGDVVIDAGAYIGTHTRAFSEIVGADGKVFSFEPNPTILPILTNNSERAHLKNITVFPEALGNQDGRVAFLSNTSGNSGSSRLAGSGEVSQEAVEIRRLDYFDFATVSFIKADVEGAEVNLLLGGAQLIRRCRPVIFLEMNSIEQSSEIMSWSKTEQYLPYGLVSPAFNPENFRSSQRNFFGPAKECGLLLIPNESMERCGAALERLAPPLLESLDALALILLHKPQYPREILGSSDAAAKLGLDYPSPALEHMSLRLERAFSKIAELEQSIAGWEMRTVALERSTTERATQIIALERSMAERATQIVALERSTAEREARIAALYRSRSWRLTRPFRTVARLGRAPLVSIPWRLIRNSGRMLYQIIKRDGLVGLTRRLPHYLRNYRRYLAYAVNAPPASKGLFRASPPPLRDIRLHPDLTAVGETIDVCISIVIPTLNAGAEFAILLRKLRDQRGLRDIEIIIVDSGSHDGTVGAARAAGCHVVEIRSEDFSHSYARNLGAESARGDYLLFMVQDAYPIGAYWAYGMLRYLLDHAADRLIAVSCAEYSRGDSDIIYDSMINTHYRFLGCSDSDRIGEHCGDDHMSLRSAGQLSDVSCLISRQIFNDYRFHGDYAEDLDLGDRLIKDGYRVAMLASVKVIHSHNRPPYYYLKRSFVDVTFLVGMFDDFIYRPTESAVGLIFGIVSTAHRLSNWLAGFEAAGPERGLQDELRQRISEWRSHFQELHHGERSRLADSDLDLYIDNLSKRFVPSGVLTARAHQEAARFLDLFLARLEHFNGFAGGIYGMQDSMLRLQHCDAVRKIFAASAGSALGFLYCDRAQTNGSDRDMIEAIARELKKGI